MGLALLLLALAQAGASAPPTQPDDTISWTELRAMPPEAVTRRLFGERSASMLPYSADEQFSGAPSQRLRFLTFRTRGTATSLDGLCASDRLWVTFQPVGPDAGPATRVRLSRVSVSREYYQHRQGRIPPAAARTSAMQASADAVCGSVDPRQARVINAADAARVADGLNRLADVAAAASSRRPPALDCTMTARAGAPALDRAACAALVAGLRADRLEIVNSCFEPVAENCIDLQVDVESLVGWAFGARLRIETDALGRILRVAVRRQPPPPPIIMSSE